MGKNYLSVFSFDSITCIVQITVDTSFKFEQFGFKFKKNPINRLYKSNEYLFYSQNKELENVFSFYNIWIIPKMIKVLKKLVKVIQSF